MYVRVGGVSAARHAVVAQVRLRNSARMPPANTLGLELSRHAAMRAHRRCHGRAGLSLSFFLSLSLSLSPLPFSTVLPPPLSRVFLALPPWPAHVPCQVGLLLRLPVRIVCLQARLPCLEGRQSRTCMRHRLSVSLV